MIGFQITDMTLVQGTPTIQNATWESNTHHQKYHLEKGEHFLLKRNDEVGNSIRLESAGVKFVLGSKSALCEFF